MTYQQRSGFFSSIPTVTKNLIIINFLFWLASLVLPKFNIDLVAMLGLHYPAASDFRFYQLFTYMFMHDNHSINHVFFNMFAVYMFGRVLEEVWGKQRFLFYYLATGVGAAIIQILVAFIQIHSIESHIDTEVVAMIHREGAALLKDQMNYTDALAGQLNLLINTPTIGASGAVFGILLAFGMLFPNTPLFLLFLPIPIKAKYFVAIYGVIELFLGVANFSGDNVAHFAHLGGMLFGFFMIRYWKKRDQERGNFY